MDISNVKINVINTKPRIYEELHEKFGVEWEEDVVITYFPNIHCRSNVWNFPEKIAHEAVHLKQQEEMGAEIWWYKFINEPGFRLEQEAQAHKKEADFIRKNIKDRNLRAQIIHEIASNLSSSMYGNVVDHQTAMRLIK